MIEKTIRDLNFADYRLVDYGQGYFLIEYKGVTHWRVTRKECSYILEDISNGISTIGIKLAEKELKKKKILNWVLDILGVKVDTAE